MCRNDLHLSFYCCRVPHTGSRQLYLTGLELGCAVYCVCPHCNLPRVESWHSYWQEKTTVLSVKMVGGVVVTGYKSRKSQWLVPNYTLLFIHKQTQAFPCEISVSFTSCGPGPLSDLL